MMLNEIVDQFCSPIEQILGQRSSVGAVLLARSGRDSIKLPIGAPLQRAEFGSLTKPITALALGVAIERGLASPHDQLGQLIDIPAGTPGWVREVTLGQLASHTSGLPRLSPTLRETVVDLRNPYEGFTEADLVASLEHLGSAPTGADLGVYSNFGYALLGLALSAELGDTYTSFTIDEVCRPMGMADATFDEDALVTQPHDDDWEPTPPWTGSTRLPAGGLRGTAEDLDAFLASALEPPPTLQGAFERTLTRYAPDRGLGWAFYDEGYGEVVWHNGATGGWVSYLAFRPSAKVGVAFLCNAAGVRLGLQAVAKSILAELSA